MTAKGHIEGGVIVLDEPLNLPEGTEVFVHATPPLQGLHPDVQKYLGCLKDVDYREDEYYEYLLRKHS